MSVAPRPMTVDDIPGWFPTLDQHLFAVVLGEQAAGPLGTLVELGTYLGKSAVVIGRYRRASERFVVVDLFENTDLLDRDGVDAANRLEHQTFYSALTRRKFEENYLAIETPLPEVIEGRSSEVNGYVDVGSARFVHVDASHLYTNVKSDIESAKRMLRPGGIAVIDDFRTEHAPGVAAAVWEAVATTGLIPVALSAQKFYGVFDEPGPVALAIREWAASNEHCVLEEHQVLGHQVLRLKHTGATHAAREVSHSPADLELMVHRRDDQLRYRGQRIVALRHQLRKERGAHQRTRSDLDRLRNSLEVRIATKVRRLVRVLRPRHFARVVKRRLEHLRGRPRRTT